MAEIVHKSHKVKLIFPSIHPKKCYLHSCVIYTVDIKQIPANQVFHICLSVGVPLDIDTPLVSLAKPPKLSGTFCL